MSSQKSEFVPFNFSLHGVLEILPNANNDGFHVNFGNSRARSIRGNGHDGNVLEILPDDGGYRINLGALHTQSDDEDDESKSNPGESDGGSSPSLGGSGHADVSGIIAIRNLDGQYLKVRSDGTLNFNSRVCDRDAEFEVKHIEDGKIFLFGSNGKCVNQYCETVRCQGSGGGWPLRVEYIDEKVVSFECDGEYLSWVSTGDGSLLHAKEVNLTSKFTIENIKH